GGVSDAMNTAMTVPATAVNGGFVKVGSRVFFLTTDRATTALIAEGKAAPGLKDGQATCTSVDSSMTFKPGIDRPALPAGADGTPVGWDPATNVWTLTISGAVFKVGELHDGGKEVIGAP
ncbi:MAG: hypothetical protein ACRCWJ_11830, partial [Casimicrobium sp.]